ncbi:hypothetical protein GN157_06265 [Flavobacterium rakeshii]|uniref:Uncharacterized protein n=1 Tax=Flavobacterium rakeshii TaxID=1038845 RepID=A0A6N8HBR5_9FLAO|nr:hypothetical protein [Flavobacterium rakeshii]MUV03310.1 hypothetical protein [Flavobacterium rakeshii]
METDLYSYLNTASHIEWDLFYEKVKELHKEKFQDEVIKPKYFVCKVAIITSHHP